MIDEEYIKQVFVGAKDFFCDGIYVKSDAHPCGWDFISFEDFECSADLSEQPIECSVISGGCYDYHDYEGMSVEAVIKKVGTTGWCFELSGVDSLK